MKSCAPLICVALLTFCSSAQSAVITVKAASSGYYELFPEASPIVVSSMVSPNYTVGACCDGFEHRNFFIFSLSGLDPRTITSATLRLSVPGITVDNPFAGFVSARGSETLCAVRCHDSGGFSRGRRGEHGHLR